MARHTKNEYFALPIKTCGEHRVIPIPHHFGVTLHFVDPEGRMKALEFPYLEQLSHEDGAQLPGATVRIGEGKGAYCVDAQVEWRQRPDRPVEEGKFILVVAIFEGETTKGQEPVAAMLLEPCSSGTHCSAKLMLMQSIFMAEWLERFRKRERAPLQLTDKQPTLVLD